MAFTAKSILGKHVERLLGQCLAIGVLMVGLGLAGLPAASADGIVVVIDECGGFQKGIDQNGDFSGVNNPGVCEEQEQPPTTPPIIP